MREFLSQVRLPLHIHLACAEFALRICPVSHFLFQSLSELWTWWSVPAPDKKDWCLIYFHSLGFVRYKQYLKEKDSSSMSTSIPQDLFPVEEIPKLWLSLTFFPPIFDVLFQVIWILLQKPKSIPGCEIFMKPLHTMFKVTFKQSTLSKVTGKNGELKPRTTC